MNNKEWKKLFRENTLNEQAKFTTLKKSGDVKLQHAIRHDGKEWFRVEMPGGVFVFDINEKREAEEKFKETVNFLKGMERTK